VVDARVDIAGFRSGTFELKTYFEFAALSLTNSKQEKPPKTRDGSLRDRLPARAVAIPPHLFDDGVIDRGRATDG
jgi:hypothetical protein